MDQVYPSTNETDFNIGDLSKLLSIEADFVPIILNRLSVGLRQKSVFYNGWGTFFLFDSIVNRFQRQIKLLDVRRSILTLS